MARKEINIGIEGNDGTGDSIRDSFKKVNDNFQEVYSALGLAGSLTFIGLDDTPLSIEEDDNNKVLAVQVSDEKTIVFKRLVGSDTIVINSTVDPATGELQIKFDSLASSLINDGDPRLAANLDANFKRIVNLEEGLLETDAATKGYADTKISLLGVDDPQDPSYGIMTGPLVLSRDPIDADDRNWGGKVAATKAYVDGKTFTSNFALYVATNGRDNQDGIIPESQQGRSQATAYASLQKACEVAEQLVNNSPLELGPYQKFLTFNRGTEFCTLGSIIPSPFDGDGATAVALMGIDSFTIVSGGNSYVLGDILVASGVTAEEAAEFRVNSVDTSGIITGLTLIKPGVYGTLPSDINNIVLVGGNGNGGARVSVRWKVVQIDMVTVGSGYTSASVIGIGGGGSGLEAVTTEVGGEIKEITVVRGGSGYESIPEIQIFFPRLLINTNNQSTDFVDDLREGMLLRGVNSNAYARIISHDGALDEQGREIFDVEYVSGTWEIGERVQYGEGTRNVQVTIEMESGIYYENYPLKLSENVTLRGGDFRRTVIRPKPGVSRSPWVRTFFRRDPVIDGIRTTTSEYGYQYLTDPLDFSSTPKNNDQIDVFLCNDASRVTELTCQGHGGFMMVLDPNGQILSKSPYCQTATSISKSINEKTFAGGQFIDGFVGNIEGILLSVKEDDEFRITIGGLQREAQLPSSFVIDGEIYRLTLANKVETNLFDAKILLERNRTFIQNEVVAWVNQEYPELEYDSDVCFRDVGLIVDAVVEDILYGGTINSAQAGRLYYSAGQTVIAGQVPQTVAAINYIKTVATAVLNQDQTYLPLGTVSQTFLSAYPDGDLAINKMIQCINIIANIVLNGESIYKAKSLLQANKKFIQAEVIAYTDAVYPALSYNRDICYRDVGYIVDAVSIDIFGDFNNSVKAGYAYFSKGQRIIPSSGPTDQLPQTIDAIEYIKTLANSIVKSEVPAVVRTTKTFNPATSIDTDTNIITIPNHGFRTGDRLEYSANGGTGIQTNDGPLVNGGIYYAYVIDGNLLQLFASDALLQAREKEVDTNLEINLIGPGTGTSHILKYNQAIDEDLELGDLTSSGILTNINNSVNYVKAILADPETESIPGLFPKYEFLLDTPYSLAVPTKVMIGTAGNKSMLANDFTQVNDMGYGIFATNNGLTEQVGVFTYYCQTGFYALNGAQIRSVSGSCAHGVNALKSEGADPLEVPDRVKLKFPTIQTATIYENIGLDLRNEKESLAVFITGYSYLPLPGCVIDIDHTGDPGGNSRLGVVSYNVSSVSTDTLPPGVAQLALLAEGTPPGLQLAVPAGKKVTVRINDDLVLSEKENIVATRPSTALIWDEDRTNVTRVLSFATYEGVDAVDDDVQSTSRDGFNYVSLVIKAVQPANHGGVGNTKVAIDSLNFVNSNRILFPTTGQAIYGGPVTTGGMIFGWKSSIYEITGYEVINPGLETEYGSLTFTKVTGGPGGLVEAIAANGNLEIAAGLRSGATGDVTVNISTCRVTGHDLLDIGTGSYADTNYPNNIFGPPANPVADQAEQVAEIGKGRVFYVTTDQSGNFRVGDLFGIDQGTGTVDLGAKISLTNVQALRLKAGAQIVEFSTDATMGGTGPAGNDQVPTEAAVRNYIDRRLGLRHSGGVLGTGVIGPGFIDRDGLLSMKSSLDMDDNLVRNLREPRQDGGDLDATPKFWVRMANLQDSPAAWRPAVGSPVYNTTDADILVFTGTNANFTNATVGGALTLTRSGTSVTATINDNVIVDDDINQFANISQHKLKLNTVKSTAADGFLVSGYTAGATTTVTANGHNFAAGDTIVISGETTVTALNGIWRITSVATNTFVIPVNTTGGGVISGAARVRSFGLTSGFESTQFTVTNGFVELRSASSTSTGVGISKLSWIDPTAIDPTDNSNLATSGKVLGRRRGSATGAIVPIDFRTVIEDGDGLARNEVPTPGLVRRISEGTGSGKFTTINFTPANLFTASEGTIVQRNTTNGGFAAGDVTLTNLSVSGSIASDSVRLTSTDSPVTTQTILRRIFVGSNEYYTAIYASDTGTNPTIGIRINSGPNASQKFTEYYAARHRFRTTDSNAGIVDVGNNGTLTAGGSGNAGTIDGQWGLSTGSRLTATWADLAEWYSSDKEYEPGTVLEFGGDAEVRQSSKLGTTKVAGVVTTEPAFVMNSELQGTRVCVALQGRVPCKVVGKVEKGDLIIASQIPGVAISAGEDARVGSVIGKALQNYDSDRIGTIEVAVGRL